MAKSYHLESRWCVKASVWEVYDIIRQPLEYPRWWPSVYLEAIQMSAGTVGDIGRCVHFVTTGLLPYKLNWDATVRETIPSQKIIFDVVGDFAGQGTWTFTQDGEFVDITFEWDIEMVQSVLQFFSPVLGPAFDANHRWAMHQGEICLREELIRYRARTPGDYLDAKEPRGPVEVPVRWIAFGALAVSAFAGIALIRRKSRKAQPAAA
jgi:hypothetical protein